MKDLTCPQLASYFIEELDLGQEAGRLYVDYYKQKF